MKKQETPALLPLLGTISDLDTTYAIDAMGNSLTLYEKALRQSALLIPSHIENMEQYLDKDNGLSDFAVIVHGVKGILKQIGCMRLSKTADALEKSAKSEDKQYCLRHFDSFKGELACFCTQVNEALQKADNAAVTEPPKIYTGSVNDFCDIITQVKTAAEDFDSITASEILSALTKYRFKERIAVPMSMALEELDAFRPSRAVDYITQIIEECENITSLDE